MGAANDPTDEEKWCAERRAQVTEYLDREGAKYGRIGEWPAWHLAPYVSIWAIESKRVPIPWVGGPSAVTYLLTMYPHERLNTRVKLCVLLRTVGSGKRP